MLSLAIILGEIFKKLKLPAIVGYLIAGVILGSSVFDVVTTTDSFDVLTNLAIFFIMFLTGLQLNASDLKKVGKNSIILSCLTFIIPFISGTLVLFYLNYSMIASLFVGLAIGITAVPVSASILMEFRILKSKMGALVMSAGIIDDIIGLIVLALILQLGTGSLDMNFLKVGSSVLNIALFLGGVILLDIFINKTSDRLARQGNRFFSKIQTREAGFGILLVSTVGFAYMAEIAGFHFIIGAFFAGLIIYEKIIGQANFKKVRNVFSAITFGFFSPLFFAFLGTEFSINTLFESYVLFFIIFVIAIFGKIIGGFVGGKIARLSNSKSMAVGYLVNSRGVIGLIIAKIGLDQGLIDFTLFSIIVGVAFLTTFVAPILSKISLKEQLKNNYFDY
jgi:Kef-type K+ transport system membrane component KefB